MHYLPEPPYFLIFVGLSIGLTCDVAFEAILKSQVKEWFKKNDQILKNS